MSTAMRIEEQSQQSGSKPGDYHPCLVSMEEERQPRSFEEVCREAAGPLAALVDHRECPERLSELLVDAVMEMDFTSKEGEFEGNRSWGRYIQSVLSRVKQ